MFSSVVTVALFAGLALEVALISRSIALPEEKRMADEERSKDYTLTKVISMTIGVIAVWFAFFKAIAGSAPIWWLFFAMNFGDAKVLDKGMDTERTITKFSWLVDKDNLWLIEKVPIWVMLLARLALVVLLVVVYWRTFHQVPTAQMRQRNIFGRRHGSTITEGIGWKLPFFDNYTQRPAQLTRGRSSVVDPEARKSLGAKGFELSAAPTKGMPKIMLSSDEGSHRLYMGTGPDLSKVVDFLWVVVDLWKFQSADEETQKDPVPAILELMETRHSSFAGIIPYDLYFVLSARHFAFLTFTQLERVRRHVSEKAREEGSQDMQCYHMWEDYLSGIAINGNMEHVEAPERSADDGDFRSMPSDIESLSVKQLVEEARNHPGSLINETLNRYGILIIPQINDTNEEEEVRAKRKEVATASLALPVAAMEKMAEGMGFRGLAAGLLGVDVNSTKEADTAAIQKLGMLIYAAQQLVAVGSASKPIFFMGSAQESLKNLASTLGMDLTSLMKEIRGEARS